MSSLQVDNIQTYNSNPPVIKNASGTVVGTFCRAWVNFNGTGTVAIRQSFNVSSITDNGTGDYTVNFTTAMVDANYCAQVTCGKTNYPGYPRLYPANMTTTGIRFLPVNGDNNAIEDMDALQVAIFR